MFNKSFFVKSLWHIISENVTLIVLFVTGALVLVIEVVAVRILSPYFGNTIYSYSSVIGVILTALSFGYYYGGKLADKRPSYYLFYKIILSAGILVFLIEIARKFVLPYLGYYLDVIYGPLVTSSLMFLAPSLLLGMLSPFGIKLEGEKVPKNKIGTVSGKIFFASTLGSIFGSLLTGFYLIPAFGVDKIVFGVAFILCVIGALGLAVNKKLMPKTFVLLLVAASFSWVVGNFDYGYYVHTEDGIYEKLSVVDTKEEDKSMRLLLMDRSSSSAIYLDSEEIPFDYVKYLNIYKLINPDIKNALVIGAGAFTIPSLLVNSASSVTVDTVDIEPKLLPIAEKYFNFTKTARVNFIVADGRRFLHDTDKRYDLIISDVYFSLYSIPPHFTTVEFFELVKSKLNTGGVVVANIIGSQAEGKSFLKSEIKTFSMVFPNSYFFAVDSANSKKAQNNIFVGINGNKHFIVENTYLDNGPDTKINLASQLINLNKLDLDNALVFTDNYAPIEAYVASTIKQAD